MRFFVSKLRLSEGGGTVTTQRLEVYELEAKAGQAAIDALRRAREIALLPGEVIEATPARPMDWPHEIERVWVTT